MEKENIFKINEYIAELRNSDLLNKVEQYTDLHAVYFDIQIESKYLTSEEISKIITKLNTLCSKDRVFCKVSFVINYLHTKTNNTKTLEIIKDSGVIHTRYVTLNHNGIDAKFFERSGKQTPLTSAKKWALSKGYTHIKIIGRVDSIKLKNKY